MFRTTFTNLILSGGIYFGSKIDDFAITFYFTVCCFQFLYEYFIQLLKIGTN